MFRPMEIRFRCFHGMPSHEMRVRQFIAAFVKITADSGARFRSELMFEENGIRDLCGERPLVVCLVGILVIEFDRGVPENGVV